MSLVEWGFLSSKLLGGASGAQPKVVNWPAASLLFGIKQGDKIVRRQAESSKRPRHLGVSFVESYLCFFFLQFFKGKREEHWVLRWSDFGVILTKDKTPFD